MHVSEQVCRPSRREKAADVRSVAVRDSRRATRTDLWPDGDSPSRPAHDRMP